ncbi:MAG: hypothetical protein RMJ51_01290 [Candidatus Calescibacterium sp.]|nr:hypothetical protein [Candidatus Calescibacterium sp.]MCX7972175.1 hypothetical protein [bacterium]MDW8194865.1 hypothetical protein [Candidatus Calescibacterium sp.]
MEIFNNIDLSKIKSPQEYNNYLQAKRGAQEFEAVFINMMLKEMLKTATKSPFTLDEQGSGVNNTQKEMMYDLLAQSLSQEWAKSNSILSEQILQQLNPNYLEE